MALIRCEDCGHRVSDLASACPECARPIHHQAPRASERESATATTAATAATAELAPLPNSMVEWGEKLRVARASATAIGARKTCSRCAVDVTLDEFRAKSGNGYLCAECQDDLVARILRGRELLRKTMVVVVLGIAASALVGGALYVAHSAPWTKPAAGAVKR